MAFFVTLDVDIVDILFASLSPVFGSLLVMMPIVTGLSPGVSVLSSGFLWVFSFSAASCPVSLVLTCKAFIIIC